MKYEIITARTLEELAAHINTADQRQFAPFGSPFELYAGAIIAQGMKKFDNWRYLDTFELADLLSLDDAPQLQAQAFLSEYDYANPCCSKAQPFREWDQDNNRRLICLNCKMEWTPEYRNLSNPVAGPAPTLPPNNPRDEFYRGVCCSTVFSGSVRYNSDNGIVQCHACGWRWKPVSNLVKAEPARVDIALDVEEPNRKSQCCDSPVLRTTLTGSGMHGVVCMQCDTFWHPYVVTKLEKPAPERTRSIIGKIAFVSDSATLTPIFRIYTARQDQYNHDFDIALLPEGAEKGDDVKIWIEKL